MWDDRRDDSVGWSWFENESPVSAKGRFVLAKAMLARGDRANAERLVREAWRSDPMSEDTENNALDQFGALLTPGDQKARMDTLLYGSEHEAAMRAAKRLGAGYVALAKARIASYKKAPNTRALLEEVPRELHSDPGFIFSKIQLLRREEKFAEAAQLMLSAPKDPNRLYNLDEWWIERRLLARKMIDTEEFRSAYLIARDAALPSRDIYKTEQEFTAGWIALRFLNDPAAAAQHFARIGVGSVNPTTLARAGYWQGRAAEAAGRQQEARNAYARAAEQSTSYYGQLARAKLGLPQIELNSQPRGRGAERLEIVRAAQLLYELDEREIGDTDARRHGRERRSRGAGRPRRADPALQRRARHAAGRQGRAQSRPAVRLLRLSRQRHSAVHADRSRGRAQHRLRDRAAGKRVQSVRGLAGAGLWPDAGDAGRRALRLQAARRDLRPRAAEERFGPTTPRSARPSSAACSRIIAAPTS